jgi:Na+/melibiose symporter-like transporter
VEPALAGIVLLFPKLWDVISVPLACLFGFDTIFAYPRNSIILKNLKSFIVFCLFPALLLLLGFIPFNRYDLTEERFGEIKQIIAGKM